MKFIEYSIKNTIVTRFMVFLIVVIGVLAYTKLGKLEDPEFTIKEALVVTLYPGADAHRVELQVTDKIEEAIQKVPNIEYIESVSKDGYSQVKIKLSEALPSKQVDQYWDNVRKKIIDAKLGLPVGVVTPILLDDYGAVYGIFLGVTSVGYSYSELDKYTKFIKRNMSAIDGVSKIEEFGKQNEAVYLEIDKTKLTFMNLNPKTITLALISQNLVSTGATINYGDNKLNLNLNTQVNTVKKLENLIILSKKLQNGSNEIIRLKDIATVTKGYAEPYTQKMYFNDKQAIGLSLSPEIGTNVIETGKKIDQEIKKLKSELPAGINIEKIYYQPDLVANSINNFILNLMISIITVVGVLLITMGLRSGFIIGSGLVLAILGTLIFMVPMHIDLQRTSLGSFIVVMGMLVDNSIVIVDGILAKIQDGEDLEESLYEVTIKNAMPLLGATFIASIAFLPGLLMPTYAGEYFSSFFWVISISLLLSWFLCLTQTPVYCKLFFKNIVQKESSPFEKRFYTKCRNLLEILVDNNKNTLITVAAALTFSCLLFIKIPKTFFPDSDKRGFTVNIWVREGNKIEVVAEESKKLTDFLKKQKDVKDITTAIGASPPRYYVSTIPQTPNPTFAQLIVNVENRDSIAILDKKIAEYAHNNMPGVMVGVKKYPNAIATEYPIEVEFSGRDPQVLRDLALQAQNIMRKNSNILNLKTNWRSKVISWEGEYSQIASKKVGVSPLDTIVSLMVNSNGKPIGRIQTSDKLIPVYLRDKNYKNQGNFKNIGQTPIWGTGSDSYPLSSLLKDDKLIFKDSQIWRKNRTRSIKVQADILMGTTAKDVRSEFKNEINNMQLPKGYTMRWGGEYFEEQRNVQALLSSVPLISIIIFSICVFLFASISTPILIFIMIPLSLIGISPGLYLTGKSFGFMSIIGIIALAGIMIKNIIVLMNEINYQTLELNIDPREAVLKSTVSRIRAVGLAALTTIFGMLPLLRDPLYGDMAATIIFGLLAATILTLFIFPVIYITAKKIN